MSQRHCLACSAHRQWRRRFRDQAQNWVVRLTCLQGGDGVKKTQHRITQNTQTQGSDRFVLRLSPQYRTQGVRRVHSAALRERRTMRVAAEPPPHPPRRRAVHERAARDGAQAGGSRHVGQRHVSGTQPAAHGGAGQANPGSDSKACSGTGRRRKSACEA